MTCAPLTCFPESAADCSPISSSGTSPCSPSSTTPTAAPCCGNAPPRDGFPTSPSPRETSGNSISHRGRDTWIASQRASLARIFRQLERAGESTENEADLSARYSAPSTPYTPDMFSSKTPRQSEPVAGDSLPPSWFRGDTAGATERLMPLMLARRTAGDDGFCSPQTAIRRKLMPTLLATDWKGGVSEAYYQRDVARRSSQLRHELAHMTGIRTVTPELSEWFMGFPATYSSASWHSETRKSRSRRQWRS